MEYGFDMTGKVAYFDCGGRRVRYCNQQSKEWTHPYEYQNNGSNLHSAGCGIFSLSFVVNWLTGNEVDIEELADFSCACGGRGDDGTDRPALLDGVVKAGRDVGYGFIYEGDGLVNDHEKLWDCLTRGGCAMCNLRVGHIVAVVSAREIDGEKRMLVIDSDSESADRRIRDSVRAIVPQSKVSNILYNKQGVEVGAEVSYAMYWVPITQASDFNLLYRR